MTTERAQKIWEAFCGELIDNGVKDSEDVKQALATSLRMLNSDFDGWNWGGDEPSCCVFRELVDLANEIEALKDV